MKKTKFLLPIIGGCAAISSTVPMMVSCGCSQPQITIDGPLTKTLTSIEDVTEFNGKFTGKNTHSCIDIEGLEDMDKAIVGVFPCEINEDGIEFLSDRIVTAGSEGIEIDDKGEFKFSFTINMVSGEEINFNLHIAIINGDGIFTKTFEGFKYKMQ